MTSLPLEGVRVIDITTVVYGPYATQILGDMGAEIIKIESPTGDDVRYIEPFGAEGLSALYLGLNRNKRSVVLDLKSADGKEALWSLIASADILVHNMRTQKIRALGFGPEDVLAANPQMVFAELVGYGQDGPLASLPAYDDVIQGQSGIAGSFMARDGAPALMPSIMADKTSALMAVNLILGAHIKKMQTGRGVHIEVPMFESMVSFMMVEQLAGHTFDPPLGPMGYKRAVSPYRRAFKTSDGYLCMLAYHDGQWKKFWQIVGRPEIADDERFLSMKARSQHINELYALVDEVMPSKTTAQWLQALQEAEIACGEVNSFEDLLEHEHLKEVGFFKVSAHKEAGRVRYVSPPGRIDGEHFPIGRAPSSLGADTRDVLTEAGVETSVIERLCGDV